MMKCAFINLGKHFGGAENYLCTLVQSWMAAGNEAIVIVRQGSTFSNFIRQKTKELHIVEVTFSIFDLIRTRKLFEKENIDVVDINGINSGVFVSLAAIRTPRVTTVHSNSDMDRIEKPFFVRKAFTFAENYCLKKSQMIIAVSGSIKGLLISRGIRDNLISVVNNGIKLIHYPERSFRVSAAEVLKICYVGRLEKVKGCEHLIRALALLESYNYQCDIYGDGSLRETLISFAEQKQISHKIRFMGFSDHIRECLPNYDVLVLPSLYEAFPLTIPEAMNAKTLLVCSNAGGIPEIIKDGKNGYLFKKGNAAALAAVLKKIYEDGSGQKELITNAYNDFINNYTEDIMIKKTFSILKACGNGDKK